MVHLEETGPLKGTPTRPIGSAAPWSPDGPRRQRAAASNEAVPNCSTDASRRRPERTLPPIHGRNGDGCCSRRKDAGKADVAEEWSRVWFSVLARGVHDWYAAATGANHGRLRRALRTGNEREVLTHPERLILTHLVLQDSRSGQGRQFRFTPPFGSSWTSSTRESGSSRRSSRRSGNDASGGPKAPRSSARPGRSGSTR